MLAAWIGWIARRWRWLLAIQFVSIVAWYLSQGVTAEGQVRHRVEQFRRAIAARDSERTWAMVSPHYSDQWNFSRDDLRLAVKDVTPQLLSFNVEWVDPRLEVSGRTASLTAKARVSGRPFTPIGDYVLRTATQIDEPFVFRWEKEGPWPWSWHVVSISNPGLNLPPEYRPGLLSEKSAGLESALQRAAP